MTIHRHVALAIEDTAFPIRLIQTGLNRFEVHYGLQVDTGGYAAAAAKLGEAIMHALSCEGHIDNRTAREARAEGDTTSYYAGSGLVLIEAPDSDGDT